MRIAFVSTMSGSQWGGSELLWSETALRLRADGHDVFASVVGWPTMPKALTLLRNEGITIQERQPSGKFINILKKIMVGVLGLHLQDRAFCYIKKFKPDLICISNGSAGCGLSWIEFCEREAIPCVNLIQSIGEQWWPDDAASRRMIELYKKLEKIYFVSQGNLNLFEKQLGVRLDRAEIVRNPFTVKWNSSVSWPEDSVMRLACIGRLEPAAKGQDLLLRVLAMPKWKERPIMVSFYGTGPCEEGLLRLAKTEGVSSKIRFCGHVSDVEHIFRENHALILPSRYEGLPLVIVEAMLVNRLVITTNVAGNGELLVDNETGFIAAAPTEFHLDEAMERAWQRRSEWSSMGLAAGDFARSALPEDPAELFAEKLLSTADACLSVRE